MKPISVTQLNTYIKRVLSCDPLLGNISVCGELSGLTKHSTGHWYFTLKDENSKINCFLPRDRVASLRYDLSEGMKITAHGMISVYERGGYYSLNIRSVDIEGEGDLKIAYENLKKPLAAEGLFDENHKRPIPRNVHRIGVVTSPTGAAIRDIITTVKRRSPLVSLVLCHCIVQGPEAASSIVSAIEALNQDFSDLDLIIAGRGGGSAEDLWAFNEEAVVRAVYGSAIPVISAVGHEIDFVLSDYAADLRAATPTAAAELAVQDFSWILDAMRRYAPANLYRELADKAERASMRTDRAMENARFAMDNLILSKTHRLEILRQEYELGNPMNLLAKGYSIIKKDKDCWIDSATQLKKDDTVEIIMKDGTLKATINHVEIKNE